MMMIQSPSLLEGVLSFIMAWAICSMILLLPVGLHISCYSWQILDYPPGTYYLRVPSTIFFELILYAYVCAHTLACALLFTLNSNNNSYIWHLFQTKKKWKKEEEEGGLHTCKRAYILLWMNFDVSEAFKNLQSFY